MVNSLTDVDSFFNKSAPLNINSRVFSSHHNAKHKRKRSASGDECNRFPSRKPPKNPRELVFHKLHHKKVSSRNINELQVVDLTFQKAVENKSKLKPNKQYVSLTQLIELKSKESRVSCSIESSPNTDRTPKLLSKSKFALNTRQSGSNFSLVVNLSKRELRYPYTLEQQTLKALRDGFLQNYLAGGKSKQRYLIFPLISSKKFKEIKQHPYTYVMENWESDSCSQPTHSRKTHKTICSCSPDHNQKRNTSWFGKCQRDQNETDKLLEHSPCTGDGYPDMYRQVLGPTPDETILAGLQTVIDMCSTVETKQIKKPLGQASSNQDIMEWVENEFSTLEQDRKPNLCQSSLCNIQQRKETLREIEKLVKKKSELDKQAHAIREEKIESLTSKTSSRENSRSESTTEVEEEEEGGGEEEEGGEAEKEKTKDFSTSLSKFSCSCASMHSDICFDPSRCSSSLEKTSQCTQTIAIEQTKTSQQSSSTSVTESAFIKCEEESDSDDSSSNSTQTTRSEESTSEVCSKSATTPETETDLSSKSLGSSETLSAKHILDSTESIECSDKSVQVCKSLPLSTKSVQARIPPKQLTSDSINQIPASPTLTHVNKHTRTSLDEGLELSVQSIPKSLASQISLKSMQLLLTPKKSLSLNLPEKSTDLSRKSLKSTPRSHKSPQMPLKDESCKCQCKCLQSVNHLSVISTKSIPNSDPSPSSSIVSSKSTQTSIEKSKSTSNRSVQTSEVTLRSSTRCSSVHEDDVCESHHSKGNESSSHTKGLSDTVPTLKSQQESLEEPKGKEELSISKEELNYLECNKRSSSPRRLSSSSYRESSQLQESIEKKSSNILSDQEPTKERSFSIFSEKRLNSLENEKKPIVEHVQKISSAKQLLKSPRRSITLEPVPEESSSKSSLRKVPHTKLKESSVKLPNSASEETYSSSKKSHFPSANVPHRRKNSSLSSERSKERQIEKSFSFKNEFSKKSETVGDYLTKTASQKVRYAMVRITQFEQYSTFEILGSSMRKPKYVPTSIETIFVVKNKTK